jgi:hypothetical protein
MGKVQGNPREEFSVTLVMDAFDDHESRLYCYRTTQDGDLLHADQDDSIIRVVKRLKRSVKVVMTASALAEFIDDMSYQAEYADGYDKSAYRAAIRQARKAKSLATATAEVK